MTWILNELEQSAITYDKVIFLRLTFVKMVVDLTSHLTHIVRISSVYM